MSLRQLISSPGREQVEVTQGRPELNPAGTSAGTHLWKLYKPLPHTRLGLEAGVGIGPFSPRLRFKHTRFTSVIKHNRAYPPKLFLTLLVSVLVSVGVRTKTAKENKCSQSQYYKQSSHLRGSILGPFSHLILGRSSTGVFHPPVIVNHLSGPVEPFHVSFQFLHRDQGIVFGGAVGGMAQRFKQALGNQDRNVMRSEAQQM